MMALAAEGRRMDAGEQPVEDEFTCAVVLRGALESLKPTVQRVFRVTLSIGKEDTCLQDGQMWLRLHGADQDVKAAKVFVKGLVNQEEQQEFQFPQALQCVFCGANGLFMDCLIKNTSAHLVVGSQSCLLISGLTEPVVTALSFITDLIEKFEKSQARCSGPLSEDESLDLPQCFRSLVETHNDRHTLNLLVLPLTVKRVLLDLVKKSGWKGDRGREDLTPSEINQSRETQRKEVIQHDRTNFTHVNPHNQQSVHQGVNVTKTGDFSSKVSSSSIPVSMRRTFSESLKETDGEESEMYGRKDEFQHLLKFFTAMGFTEDVVQRVLSHTGPKEASQLLDLIQQEQDKTGQCLGTTETMGLDMSAKQEDFVLDVLKKAAATCGYTEERVEQVYDSLANPNTHQLLIELQRQDITEVNRRSNQWTETNAEENTSRRTVHELHPHVSVKGPPQTRYTASTDPKKLYTRDVSPKEPAMNAHLLPAFSHGNNNSHRQLKRSSNQHHEKQSIAKDSTVVTGPQRFIESLKTPFKLQLSADPGNDTLRQIIIDGSNVAMSHGLKVFFSCRGIALAVQHFWGRGHRKITVFVPHWRQKKHPKTKEQHFLTELQDLGLLSFTPSRVVQGQRINSYDDRFMLRLAQQTNGVIVTNDNMRDLTDESSAWRDIIKRSLLPYLFIGDLFMLPDDPMGRGGPHLNDFLHSSSYNSFPLPGSHSFAGVPSLRSPSSPARRVHTEVLQYRDRTPGGHDRGQGLLRGEVLSHSEDVRTTEETLKLRQSLMEIFPDQERVIILTLQCHPSIKDINRLTDFILKEQEQTQSLSRA